MVSSERLSYDVSWRNRKSSCKGVRSGDEKSSLPLVGAGIFLLDESLKNYAEENLQLGTEKKADRQDRASEST